MKSLAFIVVLIIASKAAVRNPRQTCTEPTSDNVPAACQDSYTAISNILNDISDPDFSNFNISQLDDFCQEQCVQPLVEYYECLGETDYANILDGFLCGTNNDVSCFQLWSDVFVLNGSNPGGISVNTILANCRDPLNCNTTCRTELTKASDILGCCLAGIVEFSTCRALDKVRYQECSIQIPAICAGVTNAPTTPAPIFPTAGSCVHPLDDPDYPANCKNNLAAIENLASLTSNGGFTSTIPNTPAILDDFCIPDCVGPLVAYYQCTGEPYYANAINGFFCGMYNDEYCLVTVPTIFQRPNNTGGPVSATILRFQCNDALDCSTACRTELNEAVTAAGCCLAGAVEFTVCGPLEQTRFDECGIDIGSVCQGVDLSPTVTTPTPTPTAAGIMIVPCSLTLLGIIAFLISKLA